MNAAGGQIELSIQDNNLVTSNGQIVATVSKDLEKESISAYCHLFATAPDLLDLLQRKVSFAVETLEEGMKPKPTTTGYRAYTTRHYPDVPGWIDEALQAIAFAYGEPSQIDDDDLDLFVPMTNNKALKSSADNCIVICIADYLDKNDTSKYIQLFRVAPLLLQILESMSNKEFSEIDLEYKSNIEIDPSGADKSRFIIPDRIRNLSDLVARAKGAVPLPNNFKKK